MEAIVSLKGPNMVLVQLVLKTGAYYLQSPWYCVCKQ